MLPNKRKKQETEQKETNNIAENNLMTCSDDTSCKTITKQKLGPKHLIFDNVLKLDQEKLHVQDIQIKKEINKIIEDTRASKIVLQAAYDIRREK